MNIQLIVLQLIIFIFIEKIVLKVYLKNNTIDGFKNQFVLFLIYFTSSWLISFDLNFGMFAFAIALFLRIIKFFINRITVQNWLFNFKFFVLNILEIVLIFLIIFFYENYFDTNKIININWNEKSLLIALSYLCCLRPANTFIKEVLLLFDIQSITTTSEELLNAGRLIGILERILVLTFMLLHQFEAIGFLIAAKSILRYNDSNTIKTEYVLIGTMSSYMIAIFFGIVISKF